MAGVLVFIRPRLGGYVVAAWLLAIALQLLAGGMYLDIAVRDIVMALGGALTHNLHVYANRTDRVFNDVTYRTNMLPANTTSLSRPSAATMASACGRSGPSPTR